MNLKRILGIGLLAASIGTTAYTLTHDSTPRLTLEQQEKANELVELQNQIYANESKIAALVLEFPQLNICTQHEGPLQQTLNDILLGAVEDQTYFQQIIDAKSKLEEAAAQAEPLYVANQEIVSQAQALVEQLKQDGVYEEIESAQKKSSTDILITFLAGIGIAAGAGLCAASRKKKP
jgi:hypothetical protein